MTITCNHCKFEGVEDLFAVSASTGKRTKICQRCYDERYAHLAKPREYHQAKARAEEKITRQKSIQRGRDVLLAALKGKACMDCGYDNIIALEMDHRDPASKCESVTRLVNNGVAISRITAEIAKCDIVCANCHAIRTAKRCNSWRLTLPSVAE